MSRRNKKPHHRPSTPPQAAARPISPSEQGLKAFRLANYGEAIRLWSGLSPDGNPSIRAALAEAHFRHALSTGAQSSDPVADLQRAVALMPEEARYAYHLGLAYHRAHRLEEARQAYARAAEDGITRRGSAFVRGLAELELDPHLSLDSLAWLTPDARAALEPVSALLRGEPPPSGSASGPSNVGDPVVSLWRGLGLLAQGEITAARSALAPPRGQRLPIGAEPIRAHYYGMAAALEGDTQGALAAWVSAAPAVAAAGPARASDFDKKISRFLAQGISKLLSAGEWQKAFDQAQAGLTRAPHDEWLLRASLISANRLAEQARQAGEWNGAVAKWDVMAGILDRRRDLGLLTPIVHNLAVGYEALEEWEDAAEMWADVLSKMARRGGRTAKTAPPAAELQALEERRAWIRRRIVEDYKRAGRPDEAISYYKQAVKTDPENLDQRLELASALLANDQTVAARNEIQRILAKDPKHIGALLLAAETHQLRDDEDAEEQALRCILEVAPENEPALRRIAEMLLERGVEAFNSGWFRDARKYYLDALHYSPNDPQLLVFLGETYLAMGQAKAGYDSIESALATGKPEAYAMVFRHWIRQHNEIEARKTVERAEEAGAASSLFYVDVGAACLTIAAPRPQFGQSRRTAGSKQDKWNQWGRALIEKALEASDDRSDSLERLIAVLGPGNPDIAVAYARDLVALRPDDAECQMKLGLLQGLTADVAGARATLTTAERIARKQGRSDLIEAIREMRETITSPMFSMLGSIAAMDGPDFMDNSRRRRF